MITPEYLKPGDCIGIPAPARHIDPELIENTVQVLENKGFRVKTSENVKGQHFRFSGTDETRAADFQQMLDTPEVKLILCARGGYGSLRIIDTLDFNHFVKKPKWIAGFSDITVFHSHLLSVLGIESIHGTMPLYFEKPGLPDLNLETLIKAVTIEKLYYQVETHPLNRLGEATGALFGGNAAMLASMLGSRSQVSPGGKILFLEDVGEKMYRLDRIMVTLKRAGYFDDLAGLVLGTFSEMEDDPADPFGKTAEEIVLDAVSGFGFPVCFGFPAGHTHLNRALILGREVKLAVSDKSTIEFLQK